MPTLHATPYDITHAGFYFDSVETFSQLMEKAPFEEVEIQFIDGTQQESLLFKLSKPHQGNVRCYFEALDEDYDEQKLAGISYLVEYQGMSWDDATAPGALDDVDVYPMRLRELAEHFAEEGIYPPGVTEKILPYLDYDLLARDLSMDCTEISCLGSTYCVRAS